MHSSNITYKKDGSETKTDITMYANTAKNIKKYLK